MSRLSCIVWFVCVLAVSSHVAAERQPSGLEIFRRGEPRSFFFRVTEGLARGGRVPFEEWERTFVQLNGIMGKALDEEVPGTSAKCIPYFTRYKVNHPEKAVLLHFNGNACDPRFEGAEFFPGHWIYHNGCEVTHDLAAEDGESIVHVEDSSLFRTEMGRYGDKNEDIGICALGKDGKPNWAASEQVELIEVDTQQRTLRVKRGRFGTRPLSFKAGRGYIAAHVTEGPWGRRSNLLWFYNFSTASPKDEKGRTCTDVLVEDIAARFQRGGELDCFDGIEFDVLSFGCMAMRHGPRGWDANADGKIDWGIIDGINTYGIGVYEFCRRLRERLGDDFLLMADGASPRSQRSFGVLNGIESEGWPHLSDHKVDDWSGGLNRHFYWRDHAQQPSLNYVNHKFVEGVPGVKGKVRRIETPFSLSRLIFAACMFTDSAITYSLSCAAEEGERYGIYDELRMGTDHKTNWLGKPLGGPVRLALQTEDILRGEGREPSEAFLERFASDDADISAGRKGQSVKIAGRSEQSHAMSWRLNGVRAPEGDIFVHFTARAETMSGYPSDIPRLLWVTCTVGGDLMDPQPRHTGMCLRGEEEAPIDRGTRGIVAPLREVEIEGIKRSAYFVHPPWVNAAGYVFWERDANIPKDGAQLQFYTGLREAPSESDGIVYKVLVLADDGAREIFAYHHVEHCWKHHLIDLAAWRGKRITLRFVADCGSDDNTTADHGAWAEVAVVRRGQEWRPGKHAQYMAWVGKDDGEVSFYFRDMAQADLCIGFEIEGNEPVYISDLTVHSHADAIAREYENGIVLANPSDQDYTFNLKELFPQKKLRRIRGSSKQDPAANNGRPVGTAITLKPRDGLFLAAE